MSALTDVRHELRDVETAVQQGSTCHGMSGEHLMSYLKNLQTKESLLSHMDLQGGYARDSLEAEWKHSEEVAPVSLVPPAEFDSSSLQAVVHHLVTYARDRDACKKALRALRPFKLGADYRLLASLLTAAQVHFKDETVVLGCLQALSRMSDDSTAVVGPLSESRVLLDLFGLIVRPGSSRRIGDSARELVARIIAAGARQVAPDVKATEGGNTTQLLKVLTAITHGKEAGKAACAAQICVAMASTEDAVITSRNIRQALASAVQAVQESNTGTRACRWFELVRAFAEVELSEGCWLEQLARGGAIKDTLLLMEHFVQDATVQLDALDTCQCLIGTSVESLVTFAKEGGLARTEAALRAHPGNAAVQLRGLKALGSGTQWPKTVQAAARYKWTTVTHLCKAAFEGHSADASLAGVIAEQLAKVFDGLAPSSLSDELVEGDTVEAFSLTTVEWNGKHGTVTSIQDERIFVDFDCAEGKKIIARGNLRKETFGPEAVPLLENLLKRHPSETSVKKRVPPILERLSTRVAKFGA